MKYTEKNGGRNLTPSHRKDGNLYKGFKVLDLSRISDTKTDGEKSIAEFLDVRFYYPRETCCCCFWISLPDKIISGSAKAGGYGYEKTTAAFSSALYDAGFSDFVDFDASGSFVSIIEELTAYFGVKEYAKVEYFA